MAPASSGGTSRQWVRRVRTRLDRPFTPEEAQAQDAANRERLEKGRTGRFEPFLSGKEQRVRARRGRRR